MTVLARTFTPGCTRPRPPRVRLPAGLTTMPSPPFAVSDSHQADAALTAAGSVVSTVRRAVVANSSGSAVESRSARSRCQACGRSWCEAPSEASTWNGAIRTPLSPSGGQQYRR